MTTTVTGPTAEAMTATVMGIYEAFGRGDVPAILDVLADDVTWDGDWPDSFAQRDGSIAYMAPRRGVNQVADFFAAAAELTIHDFRVGDVLVGADKVAVTVVMDATVPSGGRYRDEEVHLWTLGADGRVTALRHYTDTAKHLAAARGEDTTTG
jgi:ketosteroid isomerase-like protein